MPQGKAGKIRGFASAGHYIQGPGAVAELPEVVKRFGTSAIMLVDPFLYDREIEGLRALFQDSGVEVHFQKFLGECSDLEIQTLEAEIAALPEQIHAAIGFGGGKTLDTVRVAAARMGLAMILLPTAASSNAATSGLSVVYDERHIGRSEFLYRNPDYIIADTNYIIQAPVRMLAAGIGDSLATYYEARNNWRTNNINTVMPGYRPTICGKVVAAACRDTLLACGQSACHAAERRLRTEEFEDTVEAINLLSGIGWENNGCSVAHGLVAAVPIVEDTKPYMHGECVALCLLVQLILDREEPAEFRRVYDFCKSIGLPVCLSDIGITEDAEEKVRRIVRQALETQGILRIANYAIDDETVFNAVMALDSLSH